jgi:hypothetical protein
MRFCSAWAIRHDDIRHQALCREIKLGLEAEKISMSLNISSDSILVLVGNMLSLGLDMLWQIRKFLKQSLNIVLAPILDNFGLAHTYIIVLKWVVFFFTKVGFVRHNPSQMSALAIKILIKTLNSVSICQESLNSLKNIKCLNLAIGRVWAETWSRHAVAGSAVFKTGLDIESLSLSLSLRSLWTVSFSSCLVFFLL